MSNRQALALCPAANKRRRTDEDVPASTLKRQLYDMLREGRDTDVEVIVTTTNDEVKRIPAHKLILSAMSPVIATKMTHRWGEGGPGKDVVEIPPDVGVAAVMMFLKFMYTEEIHKELTVELWLELLFLSDHYEVQDLMKLSDDNLIFKLNEENCSQIYEKSHLFQDINCAASALSLLRKNIGKMLTSNSNQVIRFEACSWEAILESTFLPNLEEIDLFKGLKRWKDENSEKRAADFQKLVKLVRLPLIGMDNFAEFVVPSGELDAELTLQMFVYFAGKGPSPEPFKNFLPRNLEELRKVYKNGDFALATENEV